jgi:putative transcriptional regulator
METTQLLNQLLIAMPSLTDPHFYHSVVYICEHDTEGAIGLVVNRPTQMNLATLFKQLDFECELDTIENQPVYYGGPLQQDRGFVIHRPFGIWQSTVELSDEIAVTSSRDIIEAMAEGRGPSDALFIIGYAGWGPGQIEQELAEGAWLSCEATAELLFDVPFQERRARAAAGLGVDIDTISRYQGHA